MLSSGRKTLLKAVTSVAVLGIALARLDATAIWQAVTAADLSTWLWACAINTGRPALAALRWRLLLWKIMPGRFRFLQLLRLYWIGGFFNSFLPTSVGGDLMRVWGLAAGALERRRALWTVLLERLLGAAALCAFAILGGILIRAEQGPNPSGAAWTVAPLVVLASAVALALLTLAFHAAGPAPLNLPWRWILRLFQLNPGQRCIPGVLPTLAAFLLSAAYQGAGILAVFLLGRALGDHSIWTIYLFAVPVAWLASLIPVSLNGLGVREGVFVWVASTRGMAEPVAAGISLMWLSLLFASGLLGGVLWVMEKHHGQTEKNSF